VFQILGSILALEITSGTSALVVVDKIMARARKARTRRTIWDIATYPLAILDLCLEAAVTVTFIVVEMIACGVWLVHTLPVGPASMPLAIVHIQTAVVTGDCSVSLASFGVLRRTIETGIERVARQALENNTVRKEELRPRGRPGCSRLLQKPCRC
jgi:hypothetical protein